ncbi:MAG: hypothetical protein F4X82_01505 [Candidatus Spechtbacteria bacterium SB0662_bin_43]|uniref:Uncharacterized protein n=1 Tax=Candidatus Spechtbacteria bacterium SB0662_bin_43 TaxID=2604897 RepID=A0A845D9Q0_9BACT|nr:hypothetical protein [Candidatus Spechtbacteria bacterium SB0662_bin_43]
MSKTPHEEYYVQRAKPLDREWTAEAIEELGPPESYGNANSYAHKVEPHDHEWTTDKNDPLLNCRVRGCIRFGNPVRQCAICGILRCVWHLDVPLFPWD